MESSPTTELDVNTKSGSCSEQSTVNDKQDVASASTSFNSTLSSPVESMIAFEQGSRFSGGSTLFIKHSSTLDMAEVMEYFECEMDPPYADEASPIWSAVVKLPSYSSSTEAKELSLLRVTARPCSIPSQYQAEYALEKFAPSLKVGAEEISEILPLAAQRSKRIFRRRPGAPSVACFIDSFYFTLEKWLYPRKEIAIRDFCYSVYDPRHWGRPMPGQLDRLTRNNHVWRARARFDFDAAAEGELSIKEDETLFILGDLGNGWLSVRKHPSMALEESSDQREDRSKGANDYGSVMVGLVPENYVQRI